MYVFFFCVSGIIGMQSGKQKYHPCLSNSHHCLKICWAAAVTVSPVITRGQHRIVTHIQSQLEKGKGTVDKKLTPLKGTAWLSGLTLLSYCMVKDSSVAQLIALPGQRALQVQVLTERLFFTSPPRQGVTWFRGSLTVVSWWSLAAQFILAVLKHDLSQLNCSVLFELQEIKCQSWVKLPFWRRQKASLKPHRLFISLKSVIMVPKRFQSSTISLTMLL